MDSIEQNLRKHVRVLASEIGSRSIEEPRNLRRAQHYIHNCFSGYGLEARLQEFLAWGNTTANVVAMIDHDGPAGPCLCLGAHYDTVTGTPGADDNASAVAVMLETARLLTGSTGALPKVLFAAFSTEEPPCFNTRFMGSRVFVRSLAREGIRVSGALVLEMVGFFSDRPGSQQIPLPLKWLGFPDTADFIAVIGNGRSRSLGQLVSSAINDSGCGLPLQHLTIPGSGYLIPEARLSDNASFWDAGIPAVMITDTSYFRNPHYHTHRDRPETLNYEKMAQLVHGLTFFLKKSVLGTFVTSV